MPSPRVNPDRTLDRQGFAGLGAVRYNLTEPALMQEALARGEGTLGLGGTLNVATGRFTGRSPKDKFVVRRPSIEDAIWWETNAAMAPEAFARLRADLADHMRGRDYYVQDLFGGADPAHRLDVRVVTELAWHSLFIRHLLRRPDAAELASFDPAFTIVNCPSFKADPRAPRLPVRGRDRHRLRGEGRPHRRHRVRRREQEVGLHAAQLPASREGRDAHALLGQPRHRTAPPTRPSSSASRARARPRSRPTRPAPSSATTSMAGRRPASSTSRGAATRRRSTSRPRRSPRSTPRRRSSRP